MSLNFGQIPPLTSELAALEHLKINAAAIVPILFKVEGHMDMYNTLHEFECSGL